MKSLLINIQPKRCEKIAKCEETIEVQKTRPKEETPFKCYIYCTKGENLWLTQKGVKSKTELAGYLLNGKVIGDFVCDKIEKLEEHIEEGGLYYTLKSDFNEETQLDNWQLRDYGKGKPLYAWHISDLHIYDKPKELSEFKKTKERIARTCGMQARNGLCRAIDHEELCDNVKCCFKTPCPPKSWCYVEEL